jgi:integrin alpha FG-GAP repeat containing protein 1
VDIKGTLEPTLIAQKSDANHLQGWSYSFDASSEFDFIPQDIKLDKPTEICTISHPHSNAFLDLDGDCLADLFLNCEKDGKKYFQIWLNRKERGFVLHSTTELPAGTGSITFADMDADGTVDMVFPVCENQKCFIHIEYNSQMELCGSRTENCRNPRELCTSDPEFSFHFGSKAYSVLM